MYLCRLNAPATPNGAAVGGVAARRGVSNCQLGTSFAAFPKYSLFDAEAAKIIVFSGGTCFVLGRESEFREEKFFEALTDIDVRNCVFWS